MFSVNKIEILGHAGRNAEVRYAPSGEPIANFTIATSRRWKDKNTGDIREDTQWHRVTAYGKLAELAGEYIKKGTVVRVEGAIKYGKYTDQAGVEKNTVEINAKELQFHNKREDGDASPVRQPAPAPAARTAPAPRPASGFDDMDDDVPW